MKFHLSFVILLFCSIITSSFQYHFGVNWGFCLYLCSNEQKPDDAKGAQATGYYWRDFNGVVPEDAYMVSKSNDGKNVYLGLVYDPGNHGMDVVSLFEGQKEITYTNTVTSKLTKNIQILCSQNPEKFEFLTVNAKNWSYVREYALRIGYAENPISDESYRTEIWVSLYPDTGLVQAMRPSDSGPMTATGKALGRQEYVVLAFDYVPPQYYSSDSSESSESRSAESKSRESRSTETSESSESKSMESESSTTDEKKESFFSHAIEIKQVKGTFIPDFNIEFKVGSCSLKCASGIGKPDATHYWRDLAERSEERQFLADAYIVADQDDEKTHLLQGYTEKYNVYFTSAEKWRAAFYTPEGTEDYTRVNLQKVFSTANPNTLKWVSVNASTVDSYKAQAIVSGGQPDGTITYIGRYIDPSSKKVFPGIVFMDKNQRMVIQYYGTKADALTEFELLTYTGKKSCCSGLHLVDLFRSLFRFSLIM